MISVFTEDCKTQELAMRVWCSQSRVMAIIETIDFECECTRVHPGVYG